MNNKTIRLIYPQWQGGNITRLMPDFNPDDASRGYYLGAKLLEFLAPDTNNETYTVPVSSDVKRVEENGILDYAVILKQTKAALDILETVNPDKIAVLGGECSVSVVPFCYLAKKYNNDIAMVWIDAHPDITLPSDKTYNGYHAMAASAIMGKWKDDILNLLPSFIPSNKVIFAGLRDWERQDIKDRRLEYGIKHLAPDELSKNSNKLLDFLKETGARNVVIHFDLDVLDPEEIFVSAGSAANGMKINETIRTINDIAKEYNLVGLTVAEAMPRAAIKLKNLLCNLPLL